MSPGDGTPLRRALPLLSVTLVNKVASVGTSLLPVLVVELALPPTQAAVVLGSARAAAVFGTLSSGPLADRAGPKAPLLLSFGLSALGVGGMALTDRPWTLAAAAGAANAGVAMFPVASRLLLAGTLPPSDQREAVAWLRTVANLGLAVSFGVSAWLGGERLTTLLLLDAVTSVVALALGAAWLPGPRGAEAAAMAGGGGTWRAFLWMTGIVCAWNLAYDAWITSAAAGLRAALGPEGVEVFSWLMVLNTVGCTAFAVWLARWIDRPDRSVPAGFALLFAGAVIGVDPDPWRAGVGMTLVTFGEVVYAATAQVVWMSLVPAGPRRSTTFAVAMTAAFLARALGSGLVFPVVLAGPSPSLGMALLVAPGLVASLLAGPLWAEHRSLERR